MKKNFPATLPTRSAEADKPRRTQQSQTQDSISIAVLLLPAFNALATTSFLDPFRAANYLTGSTLYSWDLISPSRGSLSASNGLEIAGTRALEEADGPYDYVIVSASWAPEAYRGRRLFDWLKQQARKGAALGAIDTGAFVLAFAGLLAGRRATVHYEHIAACRELFPELEITENLFVIDEDRLTCCGGTASGDLALEMIRRRFGLDLANAAARYIFHDRLRAGSEGQDSALHEPAGYAMPETLRRAIAAMERNLEAPLPLAAIAKRASISQRQLERLFKAHTGVTAVQYYLEVRLDRARSILMQTELSILEVAVACGFSSREYFARAYRQRFGLPPSQDKLEGRVPFQFRSFPSPNRQVQAARRTKPARN